MLRVDPERRAEVLAAAVTALEKSSHGRIILEKQTVEEMRAKYYRADRAMAWLLVSVCAALLLVTALGIVGLASFWVQQRTRQIGIRRALGATRGQILRYFQAENFLLATFGIALGMVLAYGINQLLDGAVRARASAGAVPAHRRREPLVASASSPCWARRCAPPSVPPAVATRTV